MTCIVSGQVLCNLHVKSKNKSELKFDSFIDHVGIIFKIKSSSWKSIPIKMNNKHTPKSPPNTFKYQEVGWLFDG